MKPQCRSELVVELKHMDREKPEKKQSNRIEVTGFGDCFPVTRRSGALGLRPEDASEDGVDTSPGSSESCGVRRGLWHLDTTTMQLNNLLLLAKIFFYEPRDTICFEFVALLYIINQASPAVQPSAKQFPHQLRGYHLECWRYVHGSQTFLGLISEVQCWWIQKYISDSGLVVLRLFWFRFSKWIARQPNKILRFQPCWAKTWRTTSFSNMILGLRLPCARLHNLKLCTRRQRMGAACCTAQSSKQFVGDPGKHIMFFPFGSISYCSSVASTWSKFKLISSTSMKKNTAVLQDATHTFHFREDAIALSTGHKHFLEGM